MKFNGTEIKPNVVWVVIPRNPLDITIEINCLTQQDYEAFDELVEEPTPPQMMKPGGVTDVDRSDPGYLSALADKSRRRTAYIYLKSLEKSALEFEKARLADPETWCDVFQELEDTFGQAETAKIMEGILAANGLDGDKIEEATQAFLAYLSLEENPLT